MSSRGDSRRHGVSTHLALATAREEAVAQRQRAVLERRAAARWPTICRHRTSRPNAALLGGILLDNEVLHEIAQFLTADDFYRDAHQVIYRAISELYSAVRAWTP